MMEGRKVVMAGSNNYLGLTAHPKVKEAAINALKKYGTSCSGSRFLTGTIDLHIQLENKIAKFMGKESALLFSTGYQAGQGVIFPLISKGDYVLSDKDNHASIVAGNLKRSGAYIPGIRPGEQTAKYIDSVLTRLTLVGAVYITLVCLLPMLLQVAFHVPFYLGGTSLLIVVVVVMDFMSQVQAHLMSQQYESLMKKANLKGVGTGSGLLR